MSDHGSPRYTPQTIGFDRNRADSSAVRADSASIFRGRQKESAQTLAPALPSQRLRRWRTVACGDPSRVTVGSPNSALRSEHHGGAPVNAGSAADRSDPDVDIVLKSYQAYARGDIDAAVSPLHPRWNGLNPTSFRTAVDTMAQPPLPNISATPARCGLTSRPRPPRIGAARRSLSCIMSLVGGST